MSERYIHYGHEKFDPALFVPVSNGMGLNKPIGGLWASPIDTDRGWYDWCKDGNCSVGRFETSFEFELSPNARVLKLTPDNVWLLPEDEKSPFSRRHLGERSFLTMVESIDFEALARKWDVLECSLTKYPELYWSLYGWDCDSILIMNPEVIVSA